MHDPEFLVNGYIYKVCAFSFFFEKKKQMTNHLNKLVLMPLIKTFKFIFLHIAHQATFLLFDKQIEKPYAIIYYILTLYI